MKTRPIQAYVGLILLLALGAVLLQDWTVVQELPWNHKLGLGTLLFLGLIAESLTLPISIGKSSGSTSSIIFLPLIGCVLLFGPAPTVLFMGVTGATGEFLIRKKPLIKAVFNSAQYILATAIAGLVFDALGGTPLALSGRSVAFTEVAGQELLAFFGFGLTFVVVNNVAVSFAVAISDRSSVRKVWTSIIGRSGTNLYYDILVSPIAIAVALLYEALWIPGLVLVVLPLFFVRQAYLTIVELRQSNRDLITALVKAIETRDPYTSGHSLRVASLAVRIAEALDLPPKMLRNVEEAALLHDIGKIEAVYSEILRKPSDLTKEERRIIESHVTKGVELLDQLSSFSKDVVASVRSHHERVDGKGYPDGLKGEEIPLPARIIKVCDAVDAMLSDRPYRKALKLPAVREQLLEYSGIQFDSKIVQTVLDEALVEKHAAELAFIRGEDRRTLESLKGEHEESRLGERESTTAGA